MGSSSVTESVAVSDADATVKEAEGVDAEAGRSDRITAMGYLAGGTTYLYPGIGEKRPPGGADVALLTVGGVAVKGSWSDDGRYLGWAPLPKRDHAKEDRLQQLKSMVRK